MSPTPSTPSTPSSPSSPVKLDAHQLAIARAVVAGAYGRLEWVAVPCGPYTLQVSRDVLQVPRLVDGAERYVRVGVTPVLAQLVADHFACILPTPRISDAIFAATPAYSTLPRHPMWREGLDISAPEVEAAYSALIDRDLERARAIAAEAGVPLTPGVIATLGKDWILAPESWPLWEQKRHRFNYGWHDDVPFANGYRSASSVAGLEGPPAWVVQGPPPLSGKHGDEQHDYSQTQRLVSYWAERSACCGGAAETVDLREVLTDAALARDLTLGGPLPSARLPGVPFVRLADL